MTTYLATLPIADRDDPTVATEAYRTDAFCSPQCRLAFYFLKAEFDFTAQYFRADERYEFHERCAQCDALIPAWWISTARVSTLAACETDRDAALAGRVILDVEELRLAALVETTPRARIWSRIRRAASTEFTRTA